MVRVFLIAATAAVALAAPKKVSPVPPTACPTPSCANPAPCMYVPSPLLNADGCPMHPCGLRVCKTTTTTAAPPAPSCCDPTDPTNLSIATTCTVEKQSCADWVASLAAGNLHYKGANAFKKTLDLAHRACTETGKAHYWVKVKHANTNLWERKSDNFKCAHVGSKDSKADGWSAGACKCCDCKNGQPALTAAAQATATAATKGKASCDAEKYLNMYPDLLKAFGHHADGGIAAAAKHWLTLQAGPKHAKRTCPTHCDWAVYLDRYADLNKAFGDDHGKAQLHYDRHGQKEGRNCVPSPVYCDWQGYLDRYGDLAKAFGSTNVAKAEAHYLRHGAKEGRNCMATPSLANCNWQNYLDRYPDLVKAFGANNVARAKTHYINNGAKEGRNCQ